MVILPSCLLFLAIGGIQPTADNPTDYFQIQVVDRETGRGVPLVELRTVNHVRYFTDSAGYIAIDSPELMNREVYFYIASHGYQYPADKFGYRGRKLNVTTGGNTKSSSKQL